LVIAGTGVPGAGAPALEEETSVAGVAWRSADIGDPLVDIHHQIPKINTQLSTSRPAPIKNSQPRRDCGKKEPNQLINAIITKRVSSLIGDTLFFNESLPGLLQAL
jgi:hypothetical protein